MGMELQFYKGQGLWVDTAETVAQHYGRVQYHWTVHLTVVKTVHFASSVFYRNKKYNEKNTKEECWQLPKTQMAVGF